MFSNIFIAVVVCFVAFLDYRLTLRARFERDETLSFIQRQLTKVWWLLIGIAVFVNLGMNFFGGGYLYYSILLTLTGLALYIHGLFSRQFISWAGAAMVCLALLAIILRLPLFLIEWITIFVYGLGWPLLAWVAAKPALARNMVRRGTLLLSWLGLVLLPAYTAYAIQSDEEQLEIPVLSLEQYQGAYREGLSRNSGLRAVRLSKDTIVPTHIEVSGDVFAGTTHVVLPLRLSTAIDIVLDGDQPEGRFRIVEDGQWKQRRYHYTLKRIGFEQVLSPRGGPRVDYRFHLTTQR